ncbi:hypothetical protein [Rhodopseudomonas palustris]|uniref:hypothetical protein n=1 Tax=Rhodopseudomonas palustris TaxID=1076 RepID=UPI0005A076F4|nr:hypothetical protein [Rhodopseudomonas palustris]
MIIVGIFVWLILCFVIGAAASNRGRSGFGWFFLAFLLSPLIAAILLILLGPSRESTQLVSIEKDDDRWNNLVNFDPDIIAAIEALRPNGDAAILAFRTIYQDVGDKSAIPNIVSRIQNASFEDCMALAKLAYNSKVEGASVYVDSDRNFYVDGRRFRSDSEVRSYVRTQRKAQRLGTAT